MTVSGDDREEKKKKEEEKDKERMHWVSQFFFDLVNVTTKKTISTLC